MRAMTSLMPPEEGPGPGPGSGSGSGSVVEFRRTNTAGKIEDPNTRRFSVQVGTKFLGSKDLRREIHSSMHKSKKLSDNLRMGVHSEDSKNNSEHSRPESSADSFDDKKSKTCSPDPIFESPKSEKTPEEEITELTRRKSQRRSSFIAKNLISLHLEEAEKIQKDSKITVTIHKESTTFSDESIDAKSCPGIHVLRLDSMSDNSLNESYTSNTNSEKSVNNNFTNEKRVPTPVARKSRFWNQKDIKKEELHEDVHCNDDNDDNDESRSCIGITTSREEPAKKKGPGLLRRTKTGLDNEIGNKSGDKGSPFMDDEEARNVFKELTRLKIIKEKKKQVIEVYNLIGMKAKTMLNQVPYVKGIYPE